MTPAFINYLKTKYQKLQRIVKQHEHRQIEHVFDNIFTSTHADHSDRVDDRSVAQPQRD